MWFKLFFSHGDLLGLNLTFVHCCSIIFRDIFSFPLFALQRLFNCKHVGYKSKRSTHMTLICKASWNDYKSNYIYSIYDTFVIKVMTNRCWESAFWAAEGCQCPFDEWLFWNFSLKWFPSHLPKISKRKRKRRNKNSL